MRYTSEEIQEMALWEREASIRIWIKTKSFVFNLFWETFVSGKDGEKGKSEIKEEDGKFEMRLDSNSDIETLKKAFSIMNKVSK